MLPRIHTNAEGKFLKVSRETFEQYAGLALEQIPASFIPHLSHIVIDIEDMPTPAACERPVLRKLSLNPPISSRGRSDPRNKNS